MTWSIIARDRETGLFGLAIASRFFAVGALCPWAEGGVGAVCTQAMMNPLLGPRSLALLREGLHAPDVRDILIAGDQGRDRRQLHLIDAAGQVAAYTGDSCTDWCGYLAGDGLSVAGNMLAGPEVLGETMDAYQDNLKHPIVERLIAAMKAGEAAGGDKRGKQSAALLIQGGEPYPRLSLRIDDHPDPLAELARHYEVAKENFIPFSTGFPRPEQPYGITDRAVLETIIEREAGNPLTGNVPVPDR
jgi:uncharacterized Ntn-hydrolase superfamily protein